MAKIIDIEGHGGGGGKSGGSASNTPTEAPNTLQSKASAKFVDLLTEGPIKGFPHDDARKDIVLSKVAVANPDGSTNYNGFSYAMLPGTSDQPSLPGFDAITAEFSVGRRVRADTPVVYATVGNKLTAIVATIGIPALTQQDTKTGNLNGYSVTIAIDVRNTSNANNQWVTVFPGDVIQGKNTSTYERSYRIAVDGNGPWQVRMRRLSPDTTDVTIQSTTMFSHVTEIIEHKIGYADSAVIGIELDAEQFGTSIPDRAYDLLLQEIEYPSNYDPIARTYNGFWDGTFSFGWCNCPAWVFRTLAMDPRFGADVDASLIDKWGLYELAQFCDQQVPDGFGGQEPRFVFNGLIKSRTDAYKVLQSVASMMRAIVFYGAGAVIVRQDRPLQAQHNLYTPANIKDDFNYGGTALKVRHNAAVVQWINPVLGYDTDYTSYEYNDAIIKYGYNPLSLEAIGTTSEGQAYRQGKWAILTEQYQTDTVTFTAGYDSADVLPGDVIEIADPQWATADFGGRVRLQPGDNVISKSKVSTWDRNSLNYLGLLKTGILGDGTMSGFTTTALNGCASNPVAMVVGNTYTFSIFVDRKSYRYLWAGVDGQGVAAFDLQRCKVRAKGPNVVNAVVENWNDDLARLTISFVCLNANGTAYVGPDGPVPCVTKTADNVQNRSAPVGTTFYAGNPQLEAGAIAKPWHMPTLAANMVQLDRDIDFTGTNPQLHLTLIDGNYDDVAGLDNNNRPARRKANYFSSNVTAYDPELHTVQLATNIPAGGNNGLIPLIWIFSKDQIQPRKWKVVSIEETDKKDYQLVAVNYSDDKFAALDENYIIRQQDGAFTDLPNTSFCYPPANLNAVYSTVTRGALTFAAINLGWDPSPDKFLRGYLVSYRRDNENWITLPLTTDTNVDITDLAVGQYDFIVKATSKFGTASQQITTSLNVANVTALGKSLVYNIVTDRGDQTFTDRDINLFWSSNALSQDVSLSKVSTSIISPTPSANVISTVLDPVNGPTLTVGAGPWNNEQITVHIGLSAFNIVAAPNDNGSAIAAKIVALVDPDPRFTASRVNNIVTIGFQQGATNASNLEAYDDPLFKAYKIDLRRPDSGAIISTQYVTTPEFSYTYAANVANNGSPLRSVRFDISVVDIYNNVSTPTTAIITNAPPALLTPTVNTSITGVQLSFPQSADPDFVGYLVWMSSVSGFVAGPSNLVWSQSGNPDLIIPPNGIRYIRYALYDAFGNTGVNISAEQQVKTTAVNLDITDLTPPAIPTNLLLTSSAQTDPVTGNVTARLIATVTPPADADLSGYSFAIAQADGNFVEFPVETARFEWTAQTNTVYKVKVRAFDKAGNYSAYSTIVTTTTVKDAVPPAAPTGLTYTASISGVFLSWSNPSDADLATVEIWCATTNVLANASKVGTVNGQPSQTGTFTHAGLTSGATYYYWIRALDTSGNASSYTTSISATVKTVSPADLTPNTALIEGVDTLPNSGNYQGRTVFLKSDGKLYRWNSTATTGTASWTSSVGATDITGTLSDAQIAAVAASKVTGQLSDSQLSAISAAKIGGQLSDTQLAAISAAKVTGQITTTQIGDNVISTAKLMANSVTANQIAAYTITSGQIAASTITGNNIAAGTITGNNMVANTITAAQIAAQTITATQIASNTITTNQIAAYTIQAGNIAAATITGDRLAANTITATQIAASTITGDRLVAGTIGASQIAAQAITATQIASYSITALQIAVGTITSDRIVAGTITGDRISSSTSLPANITVGTTGFSLATIQQDTAAGTPGANRVPYSDAQAGNASFFNYSSTGAAVIGESFGTSIGIAYKNTQWATQSSGVVVIDSASFAVQAGERISYQATLGGYGTMYGTQRVACLFQDGSGAYISEASTSAPSSGGVPFPTVVGGFTTVPANARRAIVHLVFDITASCSPGLTMAQPMVASASIGQTILPAYSPSGNTPNAAAVVNANTTLIGAGSISLTGSTTLNSVLYGPDQTKINGGSLAANTVAANKLTIGNRGLNVFELNFQVLNSNTGLGWSTGYIQYTDINNIVQQCNISAALFTPGGANQYWYIYWTEGATALSATTNASLVNSAGYVVVCTWFSGSTSMVANYGATIIDGSRITTGSVTANQIAAYTITSQQIAAAAISGDRIAANTITGDRIAGNTITGDKISANTISANKITISARGIAAQDFSFTANPATNTLSWSGGYILWTGDDGTPQASGVNPGTAQYQGNYIHVYWIKGANYLGYTADWGSILNNPNAVHMAIYEGGSIVVVDYGAIVLDGSRITAGSITAAQIAASTITAQNIAVGSITADTLFIGAKGQNLIPNPNGTTATNTRGWETGNGTDNAANGLNFYSFVNWETTGKTGFTLNRSNRGSGDGASAVSMAMPVIPGKTYTLRSRMVMDAGASQGIYVRINVCTTAPANLYVDNVSRTGNYDLISNGTISTNITTYEWTWTCPGNIFFASVAMINWANGPSNFYFTDVEFFQQATSGAIQVNAVTSFIAEANTNSYQGDGQGMSVPVGGGSGGGGGGGGFGCVAIESYTPSGVRAGDLAKGDSLTVLTDDLLSVRESDVEEISIIEQPCYRVETTTGIKLITSTTTPITLKDGSVISIMHAGTAELPVIDGGYHRWDKVKRMDYLGIRKVALITTYGGTYAAGEEEDRYILTHNKAPYQDIQ